MHLQIDLIGDVCVGMILAEIVKYIVVKIMMKLDSLHTSWLDTNNG